MEFQKNQLKAEENTNASKESDIFNTIGDNIEDFCFSNKNDVPDDSLKNSKISNFDLFILVSSILTHCIDVCIDINIVIQYYLHNQYRICVWTIGLILIPSFISTTVSLQMYSHEKKENSKKKSNFKGYSLVKYSKMFFLIIFTILFQLTMARHCYFSFKYALKSRSCEKKKDKVGQRQWFFKMLKEEQDIALLRILECFIEAAPQQILQIFIFVQDFNEDFNMMTVHQVISIASSFISMAWALVSYHRSIRLAQYNKNNINFMGSFLQFGWFLLITTSRIACVLAITIYSLNCILIAGSIHWLGMTIWIMSESSGLVPFCQNKNHPPHLPLTIIERTKATLFSCVIGFIYIFVFLNSEDCGTYYKHLVYYITCFFENSVASIVVIYSYSSSRNVEIYQYLISISCIVPFILGVIHMIIYYMKYHPSRKHIVTDSN